MVKESHSQYPCKVYALLAIIVTVNNACLPACAYHKCKVITIPCPDCFFWINIIDIVSPRKGTVLTRSGRQVW